MGKILAKIKLLFFQNTIYRRNMGAITNVGKCSFSFIQETEIKTYMFEGFHKSSYKLLAVLFNNHITLSNLVSSYLSLIYFF